MEIDTVMDKSMEMEKVMDKRMEIERFNGQKDGD